MFQEDLSAFFDAQDGFATPALLDGRPVQGIFIDDYLAVGEVASSGPAMLLESAMAVGVVDGESTLTLTHPVTQAARSFTVTRDEPDGTGLTVLRARNASPAP